MAFMLYTLILLDYKQRCTVDTNFAAYTPKNIESTQLQEYYSPYGSLST